MEDYSAFGALIRNVFAAKKSTRQFSRTQFPAVASEVSKFARRPKLTCSRIVTGILAAFNCLSIRSAAGVLFHRSGYPCR